MERRALPDEPIRNRIAEIAIGRLPGPCPGCGTSMLRKDIPAHKAECEDVVVKCPFPTCQVRVRRRDVEAHLADVGTKGANSAATVASACGLLCTRGSQRYKRSAVDGTPARRP